MEHASTNTNDAWLALLSDLLNQETTVSPRGLITREVVGRQAIIPMERPVLTVAARRLGYKFMLAEAAWILGGDNRVAAIEPYARHVREFSDDGLTFAGAYGPPLRDQLPWVVSQLLADTSTRQAVTTIWRPRPGPSKDVPCTVAVQWLLRADAKEEGTRLHCVMTMRSSDAWLGAPYDWFNFSMISAWVGSELLRRKVDLPWPLRLGQLYFTAGSQHLYESRWEDAQRCLDNPEQGLIFSSEFELLDPSIQDLGIGPDSLIKELWLAANLVSHITQSAFIAELSSALKAYYLIKGDPYDPSIF